MQMRFFVPRQIVKATAQAKKHERKQEDQSKRPQARWGEHQANYSSFDFSVVLKQASNRHKERGFCKMVPSAT
jgi:hypothetical protein